MAVSQTDHLKQIAFAFETLMREMVAKPDLFHMETVEDLDGNVLFRVTAASSDTGRLIGMQGRTARSLRVILGVVGMQTGRKFSLDIEERVS